MSHCLSQPAIWLVQFAVSVRCYPCTGATDSVFTVGECYRQTDSRPAGQLQATRCHNHVSQTCIDNNLLSDICTFRYHITGTWIRMKLRNTSILYVYNSVVITVRHSHKKKIIFCVKSKVPENNSRTFHSGKAQYLEKNWRSGKAAHHSLSIS
jgi:hypothetical protein